MALVGLTLGWGTVSFAQTLPGHCRGQVIDVIDAKTLKVRFIEPQNRSTFKTSSCPDDGVSDAFVLNGVWSKPEIEPPVAFQQRVAYMRRSLVGQIVFLPLITHVLTDKGELMAMNAYVKNPTDALFENRASVNEQLFKAGYAPLDEDPFSRFKAGENYKRYKNAENEAISAHLGIWQPGTSETYLAVKNEMLLKSERRWAGLGFYVSMQIVLASAILWLKRLVRSNSKALASASVLLILPFANLAPDGWLWLRSWRDPSEYINAAKAQEGEMVFLIVLVVLGAVGFVSFVDLFKSGPAEVWGVAGAAFHRSKYIPLFFLGIWTGTAFFALAYKIDAHHATWGTAFSSSVSVALGLALPVAQSHSSAILALIEKITVFVWCGLCATLIKQQPTLVSGTLRQNLSVILACFLIVTIASASLFGIIFFTLKFNAGDLGQQTSRLECFWLSLATLFRQSYTGFIHSRWTEFVAIVEGHVALFLAVVGFRALWALLPQMQEKRF